MLGFIEEQEVSGADCWGLSHLFFGLCPGGGDCISDLTASLSVCFAEMCFVCLLLSMTYRLTASRNH